MAEQFRAEPFRIEQLFGTCHLAQATIIESIAFIFIDYGMEVLNICNIA